MNQTERAAEVYKIESDLEHCTLMRLKPGVAENVNAKETLDIHIADATEHLAHFVKREEIIARMDRLAASGDLQAVSALMAESHEIGSRIVRGSYCFIDFLEDAAIEKRNDIVIACIDLLHAQKEISVHHALSVVAEIAATSKNLQLLTAILDKASPADRGLIGGNALYSLFQAAAQRADTPLVFESARVATLERALDEFTAVGKMLVARGAKVEEGLAAHEKKIQQNLVAAAGRLSALNRFKRQLG